MLLLAITSCWLRLLILRQGCNWRELRQRRGWFRGGRALLRYGFLHDRNKISFPIRRRRVRESLLRHPRWPRCRHFWVEQVQRRLFRRRWLRAGKIFSRHGGIISITASELHLLQQAVPRHSRHGQLQMKR